MDIYFAINWDMISKFGMPEVGANRWLWAINANSILGGHIKDNPGDLFKCIFPKEIDQSIVLCKAEVESSVIVNCFGDLLSGSSVKDIQVVITQVTSCDVGRL